MFRLICKWVKLSLLDWKVGGGRGRGKGHLMSEKNCISGALRDNAAEREAQNNCDTSQRLRNLAPGCLHLCVFSFCFGIPTYGILKVGSFQVTSIHIFLAVLAISANRLPHGLTLPVSKQGPN